MRDNESMNESKTNTNANTESPFAIKLTNKQRSTINLINRFYDNPLTITRTQIKAMVDAGDFAWPYWITDHKNGYAIQRGLYRVPRLHESATATADATATEPVATMTEPVATAWFAIHPMGSKSTIKFDEPVTAAAAADALTARLRASKKSAKWVSTDSMQPVAPVA
jgi:hypothetical protein